MGRSVPRQESQSVVPASGPPPGMQTPCMPSFAQVSPGGQSVWLAQMTRPLHALDAVHDAAVRLVAQQTSPEEHVCVPHFEPPPLPPEPPLLLPLDQIGRAHV